MNCDSPHCSIVLGLFFSWFEQISSFDQTEIFKDRPTLVAMCFHELPFALPIQTTTGKGSSSKDSYIRSDAVFA